MGIKNYEENPVVICPIFKKVKGIKYKKLFPRFLIIGEHREMLIREVVLKCSQCSLCQEIRETVERWIVEKKVPQIDCCLLRTVKIYREKFGLQDKTIILVENYEGYRIYQVLINVNGKKIINQAKIVKAVAGALMKKPDAEVKVI